MSSRRQFRDSALDGIRWPSDVVLSTGKFISIMLQHVQGDGLPLCIEGPELDGAEFSVDTGSHSVVC